ncbi:MAG: hypothetical protein J6B54_01560 [Clostridia bacterium]|nr:hypothetical protein [Clostridia bacterium]
MKKMILVLLLLMLLWGSGMIPKQIAATFGTRYAQERFPRMELRFESVEWSKYHGNYIITLRDKQDGLHSFVISPKILPIYPGQGVLSLEEASREYS